MQRFQKVFQTPKSIIAMIHLLPLMGTPNQTHATDEILDTALQEAERYLKAGVDALMIENMHDLPYLNREVGPEIVAQMSIIAHEIKRLSSVPCGIQILAGANQQALAVAAAAGLAFIRAEGFVFSHIADEGQMDACAGDLLRYRRQMEAQSILVLTDIKKKHSAHAITQDVNIVETAEAAAFFQSDGLILTGSATGKAANLQEIEAVKAAVELPVLVGSGVALDNLEAYLSRADALIIGSYFKVKGAWQNTVDYERCARFMESVKAWRDAHNLEISSQNLHKGLSD
ncbi:MAG: BtpA/SgcQ family protein [Candidatus Sericytochromatia bacterium]